MFLLLFVPPPLSVRGSRRASRVDVQSIEDNTYTVLLYSVYYVHSNTVASSTVCAVPTGRTPVLYKTARTVHLYRTFCLCVQYSTYCTVPLGT